MNDFQYIFSGSPMPPDDNQRTNIHAWPRTISEIVLALIALIGFFEKENVPDWLFYMAVGVLSVIIILLVIFSPVGRGIKQFISNIIRLKKKYNALKMLLPEYMLIVNEFGCFIDPQNPRSIQKIIYEAKGHKDESVKKADENIIRIVSLIYDQYFVLRDTWLPHVSKTKNIEMLNKVSLNFANLLTSLFNCGVLKHIYSVYNRQGDDFRNSLQIFHSRLTGFVKKANNILGEQVFIEPWGWENFRDPLI